MGELFTIGGLDLVLVSTIVIVVSSRSPLVKRLLVTNFLSFREPSTGGFSKPVVVLEEAIVQVSVRM